MSELSVARYVNWIFAYKYAILIAVDSVGGAESAMSEHASSSTNLLLTHGRSVLTDRVTV